MGKLLAGIDYSPASVRALEALLPLRQVARHSISLYHAYQLPKGLPFLSAHVIEDMEMEAERTAQQKLRRFLQETLPPGESRRIQIITQREFLTDGLSRYLETGKYTLLALGARGDSEPDEEPIGFHARHFIHESPVPVLITFPQTTVRWKRLLLVYDKGYRSPTGQRFLRHLVQKLGTSIAGLPLLRPGPTIERLHGEMRRLTRAIEYQPVVWDGPHLVRLLLQAARSYEADLIACFADPGNILKGMRAMNEHQIDGHAGWLFFPQLLPEEPGTEAETL